MARRKRPEGTRAPNRTSSIYYSQTDGYWHGWVWMGTRDDGKTDRRHVQRKKEGDVIDAVRGLERERDSGKIRKPGRSWTVEKWLNHWVENIAAPTVREKTIEGYRSAVYNHLIPGVGAHHLDKLQAEHLESLYRRLSLKKGKKGTNLQALTILRIHRTMRTALGEAMRRGHITSNPAQIARAPRIAEEEIIPFTKEEAQCIMRACKDRRNGVRFMIALTLGLRKGEALGVQWRDIDLTGRTMTVRRQIQLSKWHHGCTPKEPCGRRHAGHCPQRHGGGRVVREVKSAAGRRVVGLPAVLVEALREHRSAQWRERDQAGGLWREGGWVFTNRLGEAVHPRTDHKEWKALLNAAGVRDARLHDARHTAATMLLVLGVPARAVMEVMGWSHISLTTRYQHMTSDLTVTIADQIGDLYWPDDDDDNESGAAQTVV